MASDDDSIWRLPGAAPAAPTGLVQQQDQIAAQNVTDDADSIWRLSADPTTENWLRRSDTPGPITHARRSPLWDTGGQTGSTANAYDTPFYQTFFSQQEDEVNKRGTLAELYTRPDFTGIVTYIGKDAKGRTTKPGDVYENGTVRGNLYDQYDRSQADVIMGDLTLDPVTRRETYKAMADGDTTALARAVQAKIDEESRNQSHYLTQKDYNAAVDTQKAQMEEGPLDEILTAVGGFAGGVAATWWAGPWSLLGGAIGAGAALLNQDELLDHAARTKVQQDMAGEEFGSVAGFATGLAGWSGLAGRFVSPLTNLTHGLTDAATDGGIGDGGVGWYETDDEGNMRRPGWLTGVGLVAGLGDAALQFASRVGAATYWGQMTGSIGGQVAQLAATGGSTFSDTRGAYDNIFTDDEGNFDPVSASAGIFSIGIDAIQMGGRGGLARIFKRNDAATKAGLSGQKVTAGGRSFTIGADGVAQWAPSRLARALGQTGKRGSTHLSMLAPSESLVAISTRVQAARIAARRAGTGRGVVTADDYYRAATRLSTGTGRWGNALVQGVGEAYEEFLQAVLDPISHHDRIDWEGAGEAAALGFVMGTGMYLGTSLRSDAPGGRWGRGARPSTAEDAAYARAALSLRMMTDDPDASPEQVLPRAVWDAMSPSQRTAMSTLSQTDAEMNRAALNRFVESQKAARVATQAGIDKINDAARAQFDRESRKAGRRTDGAFVIIPSDSVAHANHTVAASFGQVVQLMIEHGRGLEEQAEFLRARDMTSDDPEVVAAATAALALNEQVVAEVEQVGRALANLHQQAETAIDAGDRDTFLKAVARANETLQRMYDEGFLGRDTNPELVNARQRAATLMFVRQPTDQSGSFQALMPQVDIDLAWTRSDNVLRVSHAILQAIGGDYDGDKISFQGKLILDDASFTRLRAGRNLVGGMTYQRKDADGTVVDEVAPAANIMTREHEIHEVNLLAGALAGNNVPSAIKAQGQINELIFDLRERYRDAIDPSVLDRILETLRSDMSRGDPDARMNLLSSLIEDGGDGFWNVAHSTRSNELLWVDQRYQQALQTFQESNAAYVAELNPLTNTDLVNPVGRSTLAWERLAEAAATEGQTLALRAEGSSLFRMFQKLHYSVFNAKVVGSRPEALASALRDLTQFYEAMSQGMSQSELDATGSRDVIVQRVVARLRRMAAGTNTPSRDIALLAQLAVADVRVVNGEVKIGDEPITLLQLLLRQSINEDRHDKAHVENPELQSKWARLEQLTEPGASGEALVEVFGGLTLWELLGEASNAVGPQLTVEQFTRLYMAQGPETRRVTAQRLRREPAYGTREGKRDLPFEVSDLETNQVTSFRSVFDSILEAGRKRVFLREQDVTVGKRTRLAGTAGGRIGEQSDRYHDALEEAFTLIAQAFTELGVEASDAATVERVLNRYPDWARSLMDLIPDADANAVFELVGNELRISNWVYEMLAMPPAQAAMHYWRNIKMAQWHARGIRTNEEDGHKVRTYRSLNDRIHQLMFRLANAGDGGVSLANFIRRMEQADDLNAFMAYINTELRSAAEAPYAAWVSDVADFAPDRAGAVGDQTGSGPDQREAISVLRRRSEALVQDIQREKIAEQSDLEEATILLKALRAGEAGTDSATWTRLKKLEGALLFSRQVHAALGPDAMRRQLMASLMSFGAQSHTKGISPPGYLPVGSFLAMGDIAGFGTSYERLSDTLISTSDDDLSGNPQVLAHDAVDSMTADGAVVKWQGMNLEQLLEAMLDSRSRPLVRAMLFPSVYEATESGGLTQQFLTGRSLKELLDNNTYQSFFRDSPQSKLTYLSMLETLGKNHGEVFPAQRMMNEVLQAQTSLTDHALTTSDYEQRINQTMFDTAAIAQMVGSLYSNGGAETLETIRDELLQNLQQLPGGKTLPVRREDREYVKAIFEALVIDRENELLEQQSEATRADDFELAQRISSKIDVFKNSVRSILDSTEFTRYRDSLRIDWNDTESIDAQKLEVTAEVRRWSTMLLSKAPSAMQTIHAVLSPARVIDGVPVLSNHAATDQRMWDELVDLLTVARMEELTSVQAGGLALPDLKYGVDAARRYLDPTFSYLLDFLKPDSAFALAAKTLHERAYGDSYPPLVRTKELADKIRSTILSPDRLGEWNMSIAQATMESVRRLNASPAKEAISMAGLSPRQQYTVQTVATQSTMLSDTLDATVSTGFIDLATLVSGRGYFTTNLVVEGGSVPDVRTPTYLLNGRFARGARLVNRKTKEVLVDLWTVKIPPLGRTDLSRPEVAQSGYRAIDVRQLQRTVQSALPAGVDVNDLAVEIDYLHPDSQPAREGYYNSIFYEGDHEGPSLISDLWFTPGGRNPTDQGNALDSNKTGNLAFLLGKAFSSDKRAEVEQPFLTDLSSVLTEKALLMVEQDLGLGKLRPNQFNAVLKDFKLRHFVRGEIDGRPVLWSAEQVIEWQRKNPGQPLTEVIQGAELWKPTPTTLRRMFGETGDRGPRGAVQLAYDPDPLAIKPYQGVTQEMLDRVPAWTQTVSLFDTIAAQRATQSRLTLRPTVSDKDRTRFDQALQYRHGLQSAIHKARGDRATGWAEGQAPTTVQLVLDEADAAIKSETPGLDLSRAGLPFISGLVRSDQSISSMILHEYADAIGLSGQKAGWIYEEYFGDRPPSPQAHVLTQVSVDPSAPGYSEPQLKNQVAPGDLVNFRLESITRNITDFGEQFELAKRRLRALAGHSPVIVLTEGDGGRDLRIALERYMDAIGYEHIAGSRHLYQPIQQGSTSQTKKARLSTLTETHTESAQDVVLKFLADRTSPVTVTENGMILVSRNPRRTVAQPEDIVETNAYGSFGRPQGPTMVAQVVSQVEQMLTPEGFDHLLRLADIVDKKKAPDRNSQRAKDLRAALQRYVDNVGPQGLPQPGSRFGYGDIIPLVDRKGQILLFRRGMKPPISIDNQLNAEKVPGSGGAGIAIYRDSPNDATTRTGEIVRFDVDNQYGLRVILRVGLQNYGNKIQLEGQGIKDLLTPEGGANYLPDHELFSNGVGIDLFGDLDSTVSKEGYGGMATNFRNVFALFGIDFTPELTEFFFDVDYSTLSTVQQRQMRMLVTERLALINKSAGTLPPHTVQELIQAPYIDREIESMLRGVVAAEESADWVEHVLDVRDSDTPATRIARAAVLYMMLPGAQPYHILQAGGLNNADARSDDSQTVFMPRIFTEVFDSAPIGDALRQYVVRKVNSQIDNTAAGPVVSDDPDVPGGQQWYWLQEDLTFSMRNAKGQQFNGVLQAIPAYASGDNPVLNGQAFDRNTRQNWSRHALDMAFEAIKARTATERGLEQTAKFTQLRGGLKQGSMWQVLTETTMDEHLPRFMFERPGEVARRQLAYEAVGAFRQALDREGWTPDEVQRFENRRNDIAGQFGLRTNQAEVVDFWIRQMLGKPLDEGDQGRIGFSWAMDTLSELEWNAKHHLLPSAGAQVPMLHLYDLAMIFEANQGQSARWWLAEGADNPNRVDSWDDWVATALGTAHFENEAFDPMYLLATDGFMHSYQGATETLVGLPVSLSALVNAQMLDPSTDRLLISLDPNTDLLARDPLTLEADYASFAELMGAKRVAGTFRGRSAPDSVLRQQQQKRRKWRKENNVPIPLDVTEKNFRDKGVNYIDESTKSATLMRVITNLRAGNALLNPLLWVSAGPEMAWRMLLDDATNLLMGQGTGGPGAALTKAAAAAGVEMRYTPQQLEKFKQLYQTMGRRTDFKSMIWQELAARPEKKLNAGRAERWSYNYAKFAAGMQDPTYGMPAANMARRYTDSILKELASSDLAFSPDQVYATLNTNPTWFRDNMPEVHQVGLNSIAHTRSLRPTIWSLALKSLYEPALQSNRGAPLNMLGALTRIPLMFSGYMMNVLTNVSGMQGFSNMLAMFVEGREKGPGGIIGRIQAKIRGEEYNELSDRIDMSTALDGINLAKMFIQGGITHTGLFALGLAAQGLGLSGEDDEERRRRRAAQTRGGQFLYDPRRLQNDWLNSDAIYLDGLPPLFSSWFKVAEADENGNGARSMAHLPWIMKQFISPIIGMERFFDTGDPQQIIWGFEDAVGSMPLFNASMFDSATKMFSELMANADDAAKRGAPRDLAESYGFMVAALGTMERMLFENSFINSIYVGMDAYDRDPWKRPLTDSDGNQQFDLMGNPRSTTALSNFVDPATGEIRSGYMNHDWLEATLRQYSENRLGFALLSSLMSGKGTNSDFLRYNMVVKQRDFTKPELTQEEAEGLLLSVMDTESYGRTELPPSPGKWSSELITQEGARAVFRSVYDGIIGFGSPALEGVFIPREMRQAISDKWMAELTMEGLEAGLSQKQAEHRMWDIWMGSGDSPYGVALVDIIWSTEIPYAQTVRYNQLNTTYMLGPSGQPYATGVTRDGVMNLFGLLPQRYYGPGDSNIGVDGRLNSIDEAVRLNTGRRALERIDDSWAVPTDAEIAKSIEDSLAALGDNLADLKDRAGRNGSVGYARSSGWSSGYNGAGYPARYGGQAMRFSAQRRIRTPFSDDLYSINTSNPIIRRATIRRERFASDRGRLHQWQ